MAKPRSRTDPSAAALSAAAVSAAAAELGIAMTAAQAKAMARFALLLQQWNRVHNLTAVDTAEQILTLHLLDSLAILAETTANCGENCRILDVGSGAGLPGIPLAVMRPAWHLSLLDKVDKKIAFIRQVQLELGLANVDCVHARAEHWTSAVAFDAIVSRAFATLTDFVGSTRHLLAPGGHWFAMKGALPTPEMRELALLAPDVEVVRAVKLRVPRLPAERHLIVLRAR
jgi:16S rRNA (guanine527-N7)-methyltransferase